MGIGFCFKLFYQKKNHHHVNFRILFHSLHLHPRSLLITYCYVIFCPCFSHPKEERREVCAFQKGRGREQNRFLLLCCFVLILVSVYAKAVSLFLLNFFFFLNVMHLTYTTYLLPCSNLIFNVKRVFHFIPLQKHC